MKQLLFILFVFSEFTLLAQNDTCNCNVIELFIKREFKLGNLYKLKGNDTLYTGYCTEKYKNGRTKYVGHYKNGLKFGTWNYYLSTGELWLVHPYKNGLPYKKWTHYYSSGGLEVKHYRYHKGLAIIDTKTWLSNGQLNSHGHGRKNGKGFSKIYYPNGKIKQKIISKKCKKYFRSFSEYCNWFINWDENGIKRSKTKCNKKCEETWITWDENGKLLEKIKSVDQNNSPNEK